MRTLRLTEADVRGAAYGPALKGKFVGSELVHTVLPREPTTVLKPDGTPLLAYLPDAIPVHLCELAYRNLRRAAAHTDNRGSAAGGVDGVEGKVTVNKVKRDGTLDSRTRARVVKSGVVGYMDRYPATPYCRETAFNMDHRDKFLGALPYIQYVSELFRATVPDRYAAQLKATQATHPDFVIPGTVFTTVTVNLNFRTACHLDGNDLHEGFGVMSVVRAGHYTGGVTCWPQYGVGVDLRTSDVVFADVHEWHANTPMVGPPGRFERLAMVFYYREDMHRCGSAADELERAKRRQLGVPMYD